MKFAWPEPSKRIIDIYWFLDPLTLININAIEKTGGREHTDMLVESVLNLIFHLHAAELRHFGGHVLKYSSHNMETSRRMEFLAVGLKSNNCSDVSHAIVRETMTAITIQSLASGVNISNMTRLFPAEDPNQNFPSLRFYSTAWILQRWQYVFACSYFCYFFHLKTGWQ